MYCTGVNPYRVVKSEPLFSVYYYGYWGSYMALGKLIKKPYRPIKYARRKLLPHLNGNMLIKDRLLDSQPFMAGRYGSNEVILMTLSRTIQMEACGIKKCKDYKSSFEHSGLFPPEESTLVDFFKEMKSATKQCDLQCVWYNLMENYFLYKYLPIKSQLTHREVMDFWQFESPWTSSLKDKRVLVIHPFNELIEEQYEKRSVLFTNKEVLPDFHLSTMKSVQTINSTKDDRFGSWVDALSMMEKQIKEYDFDIALIACGSYGYPLASKIKVMGKKAIHMGGVLQILFGIKGGRWDVHPIASKLYNEYWVRPGKEDVPDRANDVEGGCYW